jgi:hypothetical protein
LTPYARIESWATDRWRFSRATGGLRSTGAFGSLQCVDRLIPIELSAVRAVIDGHIRHIRKRDSFAIDLGHAADQREYTYDPNPG